MLKTFSSRYFLLLLSCLAGALLFSACKGNNIYTKAYDDHRKEQATLDEASIQKFLADSSITNYTRTESGLFLVPITNGSGDLIKSGQRVEVKYIGKYLNDGQIGTTFDSSYDNRTPCQCFQTVVGAGAVISGWDEALQLMKVGDRKRLFIPSRLGYGSTLSGTSPPANIGNDRVLVFDMIVTRIVQ